MTKTVIELANIMTRAEVETIIKSAVMFSQKQLTHLECVVKYVIKDLENAMQTSYESDDREWLGELRSLLATIQAEQQHETS